MEANQINILASTMLRDLEQVDDSQESGLARQCGSDIRKADRRDGIHFDLTFFHTIAVARFDVRTRPYSDTASDISTPNSLAKPLGEYHEESLHSAAMAILQRGRRGRRPRTGGSALQLKN